MPWCWDCGYARREVEAVLLPCCQPQCRIKQKRLQAFYLLWNRAGVGDLQDASKQE
jgi:hypothetical protein